MINIIYIGQADNPNKFHIGMTLDNRSPIDRWMDSDFRAKLSYVPKKIEFYSVADLRDEPIHKYILKDPNVYSVKKEEGIRSDEIFRVDTTNPAEYIQKLVEEAIQYEKQGIRPIDIFFQPRPHQAWVNACILDKFDGSKTIVQPLNLSTRSGKTLQGLDLFKKSGLQTMLIASYWLSANESFISTVEQKLDITSDITVIKPNYQEYVNAIAKGNRVLIDVSLHQDAEQVDTQLLQALSETSSVIYIDEADFGAWTASSRKTASQYVNAGNNLVLVATGTNIDRALIGHKGAIEYPITVAYLDLIEAKRGKGMLFDSSYVGKGSNECDILAEIRSDSVNWINRLSDIVEVACVTLDAGSSLVEELNELSDEKRPNMAKIFAKRNTHIQRQIIRSLLCDDDGEGTDVFGLYATQYGSIEHPAVMMFIGGTKADVNNLVNVGKSIAPHYNWVALHGDEYNNRSAEKDVKDIIKNGGGERTVIISCSMGARSFSVPNIISVINCKDGGSMGTAVQQASRCFTPGCDKSIGLVVNYSFNSERSSSFETDLISSALEHTPNDTDAAIRRVYGLANFLKKDAEGYLIKLSESDFLEYITSPENLENMATATIDMKSLLTNLDILELLQNVRTNSSTNKEWKGIIDRAVTYIKTERSVGEVDSEKKEIRDLIRKVQSIIQTVGNTYYLAPNGSSFKECLSTILFDVDKDNEYTSLVGVSSSVVLNSIYQFLPETFMNLIVQRVSKFDTYDKFNNLHSSHPEFDMFDV
jgi:hypothetical protein